MKNIDRLIESLLEENKLLQKQLNIPADKTAKRKLFDMLCTIRKPGYTVYVDENWLKLQDELLMQELEQKGGSVDVKKLVSVKDAFKIPVKPMYLQEKMEQNAPFQMFHSDKLYLYQGDITRLLADAIVNAANAELIGCLTPGQNCMDHAIHAAAGIQLRQECYRIRQEQGRPEPNGFAKITNAYNLPCKYVIHTVGPVIHDTVTEQDETELRSCYDASLAAAEDKQLESVAFGCISTGKGNYPKLEAAQVAIQAADEFLDTATYVKQVIFVVFSKEDYMVYEQLLKQYR